MMCFRFFPWLAAVAALAFLGVGCVPDRTLEALVPRQALAVVLVDQPGVLGPRLGPAAALPWSALDGARPWVAVVVPGAPPKFRLLLALGSSPDSWATVARWASTTGGLVAERVGSYAVLSLPGMEPAVLLGPGERFDLQKLRGGGRLVAAYVDADVLPSSPVPGLKDQLRGVFVALQSRAGGLEAALTTDWRPRSRWQAFFQRATPAASWSGWFPGGAPSGVSVAVNLPPELWSLVGLGTGDPRLRAWWAALATQLGPRATLVAEPTAEKGWSWRASVEARDPQAVRQALKTLVAGGVLQGEFPAWALDPDTPVIYQDRKDPDVSLVTTVTVGTQAFAVAYGPDRVAVAGGAGAVEAVRQGTRTLPPSRVRDLPPRTLAVADGSFDGLGASANLAVETDGNLTLRLVVDGSNLGAWEERLPQALRQWAASTTLWEP